MTVLLVCTRNIFFESIPESGYFEWNSEEAICARLGSFTDFGEGYFPTVCDQITLAYGKEYIYFR
jgi:hypothetical protein